MNLVEVEDLVKGHEQRAFAVNGVSFSISNGTRLGIAGVTGSGKSTLLRCIAGLEQPDSGKVVFKGQRVLGPFEQLIPGHKSISYLSQEHELGKFLTVEEYLYDHFEMTESQAIEVYKACDIQSLIKADTRNLSGGEQQRVALAKELLQSPDLLLLDEPFSNLDRPHKELLKGTIEKVEKELGTTIVMVTHDSLDVLSWADSIIVMKEGEIVQVDEPIALYEKPKDEYVASLFGPYNLLRNGMLKSTDISKYHSIGGNAFIRPENVLINPESGDIKCTIQKAMFKGSYWEYQIRVQNEVITAISNDQYKEGTSVFIELNH